MFDAATVNANYAGAGKGTLAKACAQAAEGGDGQFLTYTPNKEEQEKKFLSAMMAAPRMIVFDNVESIVGGGVIEPLISEDNFSGRKLGETKILDFNLENLMICVTGNNLQMTDDMTRRVLPIRLQANGIGHHDGKTIEELRNSPDEKVKADRWKYHWSALTLVRSWFANGKVDHVNGKHWASFSEWSFTIRNTLIEAGFIDPEVGRADWCRKQNSGASKLATAIRGVQAAVQAYGRESTGVTAGHIFGCVKTPPEGLTEEGAVEVGELVGGKRSSNGLGMHLSSIVSPMEGEKRGAVYCEESDMTLVVEHGRARQKFYNVLHGKDGQEGW